MSLELNKHMTGRLISTKEDNFEIARIVFRSVKTGEHYNGVRWVDGGWRWSYWNENTNQWTPYPETKKYDIYNPMPFLRFADGTEIEAEVYFSSGFGKFDSQWRDFIDSFDR
jgi:hypothetical protein